MNKVRLGRRLFTVVVFLGICSASTLYAQFDELHSLLLQRVKPCEEVDFNAQMMLPEYLARGSRDTLNEIVRFWYQHCGTTEPIQRLRILLAIEKDSLTEGEYDASILEYLIMYKEMVQFRTNDSIMPSRNYGGYYPYSGIFYYGRWYYPNPVNDALNAATVRLATQLLASRTHSALARFFLRLYSNDFVNTFAMLQNPEFAGTKIRRCYEAYIDRHRDLSALQFSIVSGVWIPQHNLSLLGLHPTLGIRMGGGKQSYFWAIALLFRFIRSANSYQVVEKGTLWNTDHFLGGYFGVDGGYRMLTMGKHEMYVLGGIAYDGFDAVDEENDAGERVSKTINSLNLNTGIGYRYNVGDENSLSIEAKYNMVNYANPKGTDLRGNTVSINLIYTLGTPLQNSDKLRNVDYNE